MNSAKIRFCQTQDAEAFRALAASLAFERGADAAMLQFVNTLEAPPGIEAAAANEFRRQGAKDFLEILLNIGRLKVVEPVEPVGQLRPEKKPGLR